ncbi:TrmH family RNA methyltransferase [Jeongeupia chitinilytica]|uniref:RNA methyltransferase n=1 Tax=Jeongeupia chitinilytica TaxID=1041641 RepID=A0ABQ3GZG8_9NEIS|nr:RNA methyltransferase [Jeongeupia chitinilytica]GHD60217.1 RNA methyltransferase [Jeongeupia chitinilytica]
MLQDLIQSAQNPLYKQLHKLATQRRDRLKLGLTLLDGPHLIDAALSANWPLQRLIVTEGGMQRPEVAQLLARAGLPVHPMADMLFATLTELPSPTGVLALTAIPVAPAARTNGFVLLLDGIQDPGNVGTLLRTAAAAGVDQAWLSPGCADAWSPRVLRAAMGAHFVLPLIERAPLGALLDGFAGPLAATLLDGGVDLYQADLVGDLALVLGAEGLGVSPELAARAGKRLRIPMAAGIESLNVGAAAAICLYERVRQLGGVPRV